MPPAASRLSFTYCTYIYCMGRPCGAREPSVLNRFANHGQARRAGFINWREDKALVHLNRLTIWPGCGIERTYEGPGSTSNRANIHLSKRMSGNCGCEDRDRCRMSRSHEPAPSSVRRWLFEVRFFKKMVCFAQIGSLPNLNSNKMEAEHRRRTCRSFFLW